MKKTLQKTLAVVMVIAMIFSQMAIMSSALEPEIVSITAVANRDLIQYADGYWAEHSDDEQVSKYYEYVLPYANPVYTITYDDGTKITGGSWEIYEETDCEIIYDSNQSYDNQWGLGKHNFTVSFQNVETQVEVNVVESPVASVTVDKVSIIEGTSGRWDTWEYDEPVFLYNIDPEFTVLLKDGSILKSENGRIEYNDNGYYLAGGDSLYGNNFKLGANTLNSKVLGADCTINVEILETPIESATITPSRDLIEGIDFYEYHEMILDYDVVVKYKDGTTVSSKLDKYLAENNLDILTKSEEDFNFDIGTHTISFNFMGFVATAEVNVVENPYESIAIDGVNGLNIIFNKKDGTTVTAKANKFTEQYTFIYDTYVDGIVETDKGNYLIGVEYDRYNNDLSKDVSIYLGDFKSNKLTKNNFFKVQDVFDDILSASRMLYSFDEDKDIYNSDAEIDVDDVIRFSVYMDIFYGAGGYIKREKIEEDVYNKFGIEIDATTSNLYIAERDSVYVSTPMGFGNMYNGECYITIDIKFTNGQWICTEKVNYYTGDTETTLAVFNEDLTIDKISIYSNGNLNGWVEENGKWAYYENGIKVTNQWKADSKGWCYLDEDGYMLTNALAKDSNGWCYVGSNGYIVYNQWVKYDGKWYFIDANGYRVSNQWRKDSIGWCYLGSDGAMLTNEWVKDSKGWCYVSSSGYIVYNQWVDDGGKRYFVDANGYMVTNKWLKDGDDWYYVGANGSCLTNQWMKDSVGWCFLDENGKMVTNAMVTDSHGVCFVGEDGYWQSNVIIDDGYGYLYFDETGYMATDIIVYDGYGYRYFDETGYMVTDTWLTIDGESVYVDSNGYLDIQ